MVEEEMQDEVSPPALLVIEDRNVSSDLGHIIGATVLELDAAGVGWP